MSRYPYLTRLYQLASYWDRYLLVLKTGLCLLVYNQTGDYDLLSFYSPGWLFVVSVVVPVLGAIHFIRRYKLYYQSRKNAFVAVTTFALIGWLGLLTTLPRLLLLLRDNQVLPVQEIDVVYVHKKYSRGSYTGTRIGIQYGDTLLRFESSRLNYFLLAGKRCIRAEIGQAAPGFYFVRNLQLRPGERAQARSDYWRDWRSQVGKGVIGTGKFMIGIGAIILVGWLLSRIPGVKNRFRKINR